jgi:hypothetical protein
MTQSAGHPNHRGLPKPRSLSQHSIVTANLGDLQNLANISIIVLLDLHVLTSM